MHRYRPAKMRKQKILPIALLLLSVSFLGSCASGVETPPPPEKLFIPRATPIETPVPAAPPLTLKVPADFLTIQAAIAASKTGDTILVSPGVYYENLKIGNKSGLSLRSEMGAESTVIDGSNSSRWTIEVHHSSDINIDGFTVRNSWNQGIYEFYSKSCVISSCIITGNRNGGIFLNGGSARVINNVIARNTTYTGGWFVTVGIDVVNKCIPFIANNIVVNNTGGAGVRLASTSSDTVMMTNNVIMGNSGWGIVAFAGHSDTRVLNNIVASNGEGGIVAPPEYQWGRVPFISNNDVWANGASNYGGILKDLTGTQGNISSDPQLKNPKAGDYHLLPLSPCIDAGTNTGVPSWLSSDFEGDPRIAYSKGGWHTVDIGADEYVPAESGQ